MYKPVDADVIIIGGGVAGLTAAYWLFLKEPTLDVIVLEAGEHVGGRAFSVPLLIEHGKRTAMFDLGAQWVCKEQNQLLRLFDSLGIEYQLTPKFGKIIIQYQELYTSEKHEKGSFAFFRASDKFQLARYIMKVELLCRAIKANENSKHVDTLSETTLEHFINETVSSDAVRAVLRHMVYLNCGVHPHQISALFYIFFCISTRGICHQLPTEERTLLEYRIKGGVRSLCDKLVAAIGEYSVVLDEQVRSVTLGPRYVEIVSKHTTYCCSSVIVAVPPKDVLNIKFSPGLRENHLEALRKTCPSTVTNFVATYEREFWRDSDLSGECYFFDGAHSEGPVDYCANISTASTVALAGRLFNPKASNRKFPVHRSEVLNQLTHYLGPEAYYPIDYAERSWTQHVCQMAGWETGNKDYIRSVSRSYDARLYFAGAETSPEWYGYVAGAVSSGITAALQALSVLRPAALNSSDVELMRYNRRRSQRIPLRTYYAESTYALVDNWKVIVSLCVVVLLGFWRFKKKLFFFR